MKAIHGRIETLRRDLARSEKTHAQAAGQLKQTESAIADINRSLRDLGRQRDGIQAQLTALGKQSQRLEAQIGAQQAQLGQLLYRQYVNGEGEAGPLQRFLAGADPNQAARDLHYLSLLSFAKADLLRQLHDSLGEKQRLTETARARHDELAAVEGRQQQQRAALQERQEERQAVLARLAGKIKGQRHEIDTLRRNEKRLALLIKRLARVARRPAKTRSPARRPVEPALRNEHTPQATGFSGDFARLRGQLSLPTRGELLNRFGSPRAGGGATWKGLFIRAPAGAPVKAVAPGQVVFADWLRGFGNLIIVDHGDGYLTVYGDNQSLLRRVGDTVKTGDTLAAVGNSGSNPESGLYFELRHQGLAIDPLKWVNLK